MRVRVGWNLRFWREWSVGPLVIRLHRWVKVEQRPAPVLLSDDEVTPAVPVERVG